jgi:hypothetical protein
MKADPAAHYTEQTAIIERRRAYRRAADDAISRATYRRVWAWGLICGIAVGMYVAVAMVQFGRVSNFFN